MRAGLSNQQESWEPIKIHTMCLTSGCYHWTQSAMREAREDGQVDSSLGMPRVGRSVYALKRRGATLV